MGFSGKDNGVSMKDLPWFVLGTVAGVALGFFVSIVLLVKQVQSDMTHDHKAQMMELLAIQACE